MYRAVADIALDTALIAATSLYAHWLAEHKGGEPDFVWAEVVVGTALCLAHAHAGGRLHCGDWDAHDRRVWRAFVIGGTPIIVGELMQWQRRRRRRAQLAARWGS